MNNASTYALQCTDGLLGLSYSDSIASPAFKSQGQCLGGSLPDWASQNNRWAPENAVASEVGTVVNYVFFSDSQATDNNNHRIGWAASLDGATAGAYSTYATEPLFLGGASGGDIDQHLFVDDDGATFLAWKTDDNNVGMSFTRLWLQSVKLAEGIPQVSLSGSPVQILDSTGMWWVDSWVAGGSLVEGPEIVKNNGFYYLFFAAGRFCQTSYSEGVARSKNIWGPYEKMGSPLLSTGIVGVNTADGLKLLGPGHASFVRDRQSQAWYAVFHASTASGSACVRWPFLGRLVFGTDDWPYIDW